MEVLDSLSLALMASSSSCRVGIFYQEIEKKAPHKRSIFAA
jgi:hypothetical protein